MRPSAVLFLLTLVTAAVSAATYEVGPGKALTTIGAVPWESLNAGDTVKIYWQATPYREKWVINRTGTSGAPITVTGVPGPGGALPIISGENATTRSQLAYWGRQRAVIKVGGASTPGDALATWIVIENLDVISARPPYTYTSPTGVVESYVDAASSIFIETADHVTVRNCIIRDSSNGLFAAYNPSSNILVTGCYIYSNGRSGSVYEHNVYTETRGITFEYNRFGPLRAGCLGNNLKDRSAGTVVRYNWIEGGSRQIDLVESNDFADIRNDPAYHTTYVYGNVLSEPVGDGNRQMIHYGGDNGDETLYRKGTLYLYNNTVISKRTDKTTLLRLSTNAEHCDARNNLIYVAAAGSTLELLDDTGTLTLTKNWLKTGFSNSFFGAGAVTASGNVTGTAPGFTNEAGADYHPTVSSPCIGAATALAAAVLPAQALSRQYLAHQQSEPRADVQDIGAFIRPGVSLNAAPTISVATATPAAVTGTTTAVAVTASDDAGETALTYTWSASGPAGVTFSPNGANAAKASTATFTVSGSYSLIVTALDAGGLSATSTVPVTVTVSSGTGSGSGSGTTGSSTTTAGSTTGTTDDGGGSGGCGIGGALAVMLAVFAIAWTKYR